MNKEAFLELADALDSGRYIQTTGKLEKNGCHCVAGVACAVFKDRLGLKRRVDWKGNAGYAGPDSEFYDELCAPPEVKEFLGVFSRPDSLFSECMALNDFKKQPFSVIADYIRESVEKES